jgi:hypothetical protein
MGGEQVAADRLRLGPALAPATFVELVRSDVERDRSRRAPRRARQPTPLVVMAPRDAESAAAIAAQLKRQVDQHTLLWFRFAHLPSSSRVAAARNECSQLVNSLRTIAPQ